MPTGDKIDRGHLETSAGEVKTVASTSAPDIQCATADVRRAHVLEHRQRRMGVGGTVRFSIEDVVPMHQVRRSVHGVAPVIPVSQGHAFARPKTGDGASRAT